ncbi:MAG: RHS domain-containing protein [Candidatus Thiodiazotropha sp.]
MLKNGVAYSIKSDHVGTPHSVTDEKNRLQWQAEYDPFGRAVNVSHTNRDYLWQKDLTTI